MLESQGLLNKFKTCSKKQRERAEVGHHTEHKAQVRFVSLSFSFFHYQHSLLLVRLEGSELRVSNVISRLIVPEANTYLLFQRAGETRSLSTPESHQSPADPQELWIYLCVLDRGHMGTNNFHQLVIDLRITELSFWLIHLCFINILGAPGHFIPSYLQVTL